MFSEKVLNIGVCLSDYLRKLKEEYPRYELSAINLRATFKDNESEFLTYSISGNPTLSEDILSSVCNEDLKLTDAVITEDDPAIIQFDVILVSTITKGVLQFTDVVYAPAEVESEEVPVVDDRKKPCNNDSCACSRHYDVSDIEFSEVLRDFMKITGMMGDLVPRSSSELSFTKCNKDCCGKYKK